MTRERIVFFQPWGFNFFLFWKIWINKCRMRFQSQISFFQRYISMQYLKRTISSHYKNNISSKLGFPFAVKKIMVCIFFHYPFPNINDSLLNLSLQYSEVNLPMKNIWLYENTIFSSIFKCIHFRYVAHYSTTKAQEKKMEKNV